MAQEVERMDQERTGKEPYDRPLLVRHGPLRDVTGAVSPIGELIGELEGEDSIPPGE
jgi:hypothetical protein